MKSDKMMRKIKQSGSLSSGLTMWLAWSINSQCDKQIKQTIRTIFWSLVKKMEFSQ